MKEEPEGRRFIPPTLRTSLGFQDQPSRGAVVLNLDLGEEFRRFQHSFQGLGWKVTRVKSQMDLIELLDGPDAPRLVMTDQIHNLEWLVGARVARSPETLIFVVAEEDRAAIAREIGADFVVLRPINLADPLQTEGC